MDPKHLHWAREEAASLVELTNDDGDEEEDENDDDEEDHDDIWELRQQHFYHSQLQLADTNQDGSIDIEEVKPLPFLL